MLTAKSTRYFVFLSVVLIFPFASPATAQDLEKGVAAYHRGDYAAALKEWRPLAEQGDAVAQLYLGRIYEKGLGVIQSHAQAAKWYHMAAKQGLPASLGDPKSIGFLGGLEKITSPSRIAKVQKRKHDCITKNYTIC